MAFCVCSRECLTVPMTSILPVWQVWVDAELDSSGRVQFSADSDSEVTRGLAAVLVTALSGLTPAQVLEVRHQCRAKFAVVRQHRLSLSCVQRYLSPLYFATEHQLRPCAVARLAEPFLFRFALSRHSTWLQHHTALMSCARECGWQQHFLGTHMLIL